MKVGDLVKFHRDVSESFDIDRGLLIDKIGVVLKVENYDAWVHYGSYGILRRNVQSFKVYCESR
jgi:hypothetical protein